MAIKERETEREREREREREAGDRMICVEKDGSFLSFLSLQIQLKLWSLVSEVHKK